MTKIEIFVKSQYNKGIDKWSLFMASWLRVLIVNRSIDSNLANCQNVKCTSPSTLFQSNSLGRFPTCVVLKGSIEIKVVTPRCSLMGETLNYGKSIFWTK